LSERLERRLRAEVVADEGFQADRVSEDNVWPAYRARDPGAAVLLDPQLAEPPPSAPNPVRIESPGDPIDDSTTT
jgi:hypothetical protein